MSPKTICRLSLNDYGSMWIEARSLKSGFSVFVWDDEVVTKPEKIGTVKENYSWKCFVGFLMNLEEGFVVTDNLSMIEVEGEDGLVADCLRMAWSYRELGSEVLDWLLTIGDEEFNFLDSSFHILDNTANYGDADFNGNSDYQLILELIDLLRIKVERNILVLFANYKLSRKKESVLKLIEILEEEQKHQFVRKENSKAKLLEPFVNRIEEISNLFKNEERRIGAGISGSKPSSRTVVRQWLENYVIEHGFMPDGKHEVFIPFLGGRISEGEIDFANISLHR